MKAAQVGATEAGNNWIGYERGDPRSSGAVVNVTIQTPNPTAFDASRTQIAAGLARAVRSGMRGL